MNSYGSNLDELRRYATSLINIENAKAILDLGCGRGQDLRIIGSRKGTNNLRLVGLDIAQSNVENAKRETQDDPRYEFVEHDVDQSLPFSSNSG